MVSPAGVQDLALRVRSKRLPAVYMMFDGAACARRAPKNDTYPTGRQMTNLRILIARTCLGLRRLTSVDLEREEGQTLAEYGLILALIALVVIGAVVIFGGQVNQMFQEIGSSV